MKGEFFTLDVPPQSAPPIFTLALVQERGANLSIVAQHAFTPGELAEALGDDRGLGVRLFAALQKTRHARLQRLTEAQITNPTNRANRPQKARA